MKEIDNVLRVLEQTLYAIQNDNSQPLKELSDQTLHAATTGDEDNLLVAVVVYSLGKILSRSDYRTLRDWESFHRIVTSSLKCSINDLKKGNTDKFRKDFMLIKKAINKVSGKLKTYIKEVFKNAEISKASRIYEHGISAGKTARMLGITLYDLQNYIGQTGISEVSLNQTINVKTRIKMLEDLFTK
ncbi:MAG: hypothetical protein PF542_03895 [Nanoarchaeota archaeon]|jgi:intein/homing endonuclease|nr:hypothetical protein [Nanoarchaeota archaeon]